MIREAPLKYVAVFRVEADSLVEAYGWFGGKSIRLIKYEEQTP
jgi:hypothetical protein